MTEDIHSMAEKKKPTFEEALGRLEAIVLEMEQGKLPLEESVKRFEEGMKLSRECATKLGEAEKKIEMLFQKADGNLTWREAQLENGADNAV